MTVGAVPSALRPPLIPGPARDAWLRLAELLRALPDESIPCRLGYPDDWWPTTRRQLGSHATAAAVAACLTCPAREDCLAYALAAEEREGVWGGLLPAERKAPRSSKTACGGVIRADDRGAPVR